MVGYRSNGGVVLLFKGIPYRWRCIVCTHLQRSTEWLTGRCNSMYMRRNIGDCCWIKQPDAPESEWVIRSRSALIAHWLGS